MEGRSFVNQLLNCGVFYSYPQCPAAYPTTEPHLCLLYRTLRYDFFLTFSDFATDGLEYFPSISDYIVSNPLLPVLLLCRLNSQRLSSNGSPTSHISNYIVHNPLLLIFLPLFQLHSQQIFFTKPFFSLFQLHCQHPSSTGLPTFHFSDLIVKSPL